MHSVVSEQQIKKLNLCTYSQPMNFVYFWSVFYTIAIRNIKFLFKNHVTKWWVLKYGAVEFIKTWNFCDNYISKKLQIHQKAIPLLLSDIVLVRQQHSFVMFSLVSDITWVLHFLLYNNITNWRYFFWVTWFLSLLLKDNIMHLRHFSG